MSGDGTGRGLKVKLLQLVVIGLELILLWKQNGENRRKTRGDILRWTKSQLLTNPAARGSRDRRREPELP